LVEVYVSLTGILTLNVMKVKKSENLFANIIKDLYSAENQLEKALPKLAKKASDQELAKSLEEHLKVTQKQKERLEKICEMMNISPRGKKCIAMEGIIHELESDLAEIEKENLMDPDLILGAQKVEHYEIACYGTACAMAKLMGNDEVLNLLHESLEEEKQQDLALTELAESSINERAMRED
jgi:ferritin-like metal-binding protein YciE